MITPDALIAAGQKRLAHRSYHDTDGRIRMLRDDGQATWLTHSQHRDLVMDYAEAMRPINGRLKLGFALAIPVTLLTLVITFNLGIGEMIDTVPVPGLSAFAAFIVLTWWPFVVLVQHWRSVRAVNSALNRLLRELPLAPAPPARPATLHTLEIVALFLVGPGILIDVFGSLLPQAFAGTPFMGRSVGLDTLVGLAIFGFIAVRRSAALHRLVNHRRSRESAASSELGSPPDPTSRLRNVVARARPADDRDPSAP